VCQSLSDALSIQSGDGQSGAEGAALAPVTLRLVDGGGNAVAGRAVSFSPPAGGTVTPNPATTSATGLVSVTLRLPPVAGSYQYVAVATGAPAVNIAATATPAPAGTSASVAGADHVASSASVPEGNDGPAAAAHLRDPRGALAASDGSIYFADTGVHRVKKISPDGTISVVAGTGTAGAAGDLGPAGQAQLSSPVDVALDEVSQTLYIADAGNNRVRAVDLATGTIRTYAGGGAGADPFGDGGAAAAANLANPTRLALGPDRSLWIADEGHERLRRVDRVTQNISTPLKAATCVNGETRFIACSAAAPCPMAFDAAGTLFVGGQSCNGGSSASAVFRVDGAGAPTVVAGIPSGSIADGTPAASTSFANVADLAFDAAGNLFVADSGSGQHRVRRIDGTTTLTTVVAGTGTAANAGEQVAAAGSPLNVPESIAIDADGDLLVGEVGGDSIRRIPEAGGATPTAVSFTIAGGDGQSTERARQLPALLAVKVEVGGAPVLGARVEWTTSEGAALAGTTSFTAVGGVAQMGVRVGLALGAYTTKAHLYDLHGAEVPGSPLTFTTTATAPADGVIYTAVNVLKTSGFVGMDGPSTMAKISQARAVTVASDGTMYVSELNRVYRVSPLGQIEHIAGTGAGAYNGDFGDALSINLGNVRALAIDETTGQLYAVANFSNRVYGIDLASSSIYLLAGGGPDVAPFGDGGPGTQAALNGPNSMVLDEVNRWLYIGDDQHDRVRKLDLDTGIITTALGNSCPAGVVAGYGGNFFQSAHVALGPDGSLYASANLCGTAPNNGRGIIRLNPDGTQTHIAGRGGGMNADGVLATQAELFGGIGGIAVDATGVYFIFGNRVRRIDPMTGIVETYAGSPSGTAGNTGDYGPAASALLDQPMYIQLAFGHLYVADAANHAIRVVE
jgi:sugar lactone lactonase YvrE